MGEDKGEEKRKCEWEGHSVSFENINNISFIALKLQYGVRLLKLLLFDFWLCPKVTG